MTPRIARKTLIAALAMLGAATTVGAAEPAPQNVVSFSATANIEVTKDLLTITMNTSKEGQDAATVQTALKQALDAALTEARKAAQPGQLDVRTGNFSLFPRYGNQGRITGWQGSAELVLEGRDLQRVTQTAGRISTLTVANVMQSLSREARERHEGEAASRAIAQYKLKAQDYARQFGFGSYTLREVNVSTNEQGGFPQPMAMRAKASMSEDAALPVEAGKGLVTATVSGSVVLAK